MKNAYRAIDRMADRKYLGKCMNQRFRLGDLLTVVLEESERKSA